MKLDSKSNKFEIMVFAEAIYHKKTKGRGVKMPSRFRVK